MAWASTEIERRYNLSHKAAWFRLHRIPESIKAGPLVAVLSGTIVADETFIGGKHPNRHAPKHVRIEPRQRTPTQCRGASRSLISKESGEVRTRVLNDVQGALMRKAIAEQVNTAGSHLHTDDYHGYYQVGSEFLSHQSVNRTAKEYVRGNVTTQSR